MGHIGKLSSILFLLSTLFFSACQNETKKQNQTTTQVTPSKPKVLAPAFNADSAYKFIKAQVDFGPRVPGTKAHENCANYLVKKLESYHIATTVQTATIKVFNGKQFKMKNIIGSYNPSVKKRYLLCSHWDTRPFADRDSIHADQPNDGANDGASGVGILLEMARLLDSAKLDIGVDIIFFDLEDYAKESEEFCLGSKYWAENPHVPDYNATFGILMDMVGAKDATFLRDQTSDYYARGVLDKVWGTAAYLGYARYFLNDPTSVLDDHYNINTIRAIPTIDIIHMLPETNKFGSYWHRHSDNMDSVDKTTLKAVGQTLLQVLYSE